MAFLTGGDSTLYSLHQDGGKLTGSVEGGDISFFGGSDAPLPLTDGTVDGSKVTFKAGSSTYTGTVNGDRLELKRVIKLRFEWNRRPNRRGSAAGNRTSAGRFGSIDRFFMGNAAGHPGCSAAGSAVRGSWKLLGWGHGSHAPIALLFGWIVVEILTEPALHLCHAHALAFVVVDDLIAANLTETEISRLRMCKVESADA